MRVWYITMQFPVPSETFAASDVKTLQDKGVDISVHSLRFARNDLNKRLAGLGLDALKVTHATARSILNGLFIGLARPVLSISLLFWISKHSWRNPIHLIKSVVLSPRALDLFSAIEKKKPEVVHLFWGHLPSLVGHLVERFAHQTVVSVFLGAYDLLAGYEGSSDVARRSDIVWTHANCNVPAIESIGVPRGKISVCYRGIDITKTLGKDIARVNRRIVVAARLVKEKGVDQILRTFQIIQKKWPDASLVVLGDGPQRSFLENLAVELNISQSVAFKGHVSHDKVFEEMLASELFMLLTQHPAERLPNAAKEAMACGCVCLVSESPGIEELIEEGQTGYVVPFDGDIVAGRVDKIFSNPPLAEQIVKNARKHVASCFDAKVSMQKYCDSWQQLIREKTDLVREL